MRLLSSSVSSNPITKALLARIVIKQFILVEYELLYQLYSMEEEFLNQEYQNCLGSGRYCALDPDASKIGTGRQVVEESLRQICLFKHFPNEWFKYMVQAFN